MKNKFVLMGIAAIIIAIIFGGNAYQQLVSENMDEVYLNLAYSTLCLSIAVYVWHIKDEKQKHKSES